MTSQEAVTRLLEALPEFRLDYETSDARPTEPGEVLVEDLAADGDDAVVNAVWVSLIEWFAWGSDEERAALEAADPLQGPKTKAIRTHYRDPPRSTDEIRATRVRRSTSAILLVGGVVIGLAGVVDGSPLAVVIAIVSWVVVVAGTVWLFRHRRHRR